MTVPALIAALLLLAAAPAAAQTTQTTQTPWPNLREGDFVLKDFAFASGEVLPELKLHYRTLGTARRNAAGEIVNGVVLLHGTSGSGADWLRASRTASGAADHRNRAMGCAPSFRTTATTTS